MMKTFVQHHFQNISWHFLTEFATQVIEQAITIQQIPAPTFNEKARAKYIADQFAQIGLKQVHIDSQHNVYGVLTGTQKHDTSLMLTAHIDTVFPEETNLSIRETNTRIYGPGIGDNSVAVSALVNLAKWLSVREYAHDIWFVATTCEEGLGDLKGMRSAFQTLKEQIDLVINLEGLALGHIYHAGIAVQRLHITAKAEGGHSWLHFGRPSAVHGILELGTRITKIPIPTTPRTTYNIGMIEGGEVINAIAREASLWLDIRSEQHQNVLNFRERVNQIIAEIEGETTGLIFSTRIVGERPAGYLEPTHALVAGASEILKLLGMTPGLENGSTDANIPLSEGIPAITIGITRGGHAHRLDEFIEIAPVQVGLQQLIILVLATLDYQVQKYQV